MLARALAILRDLCTTVALCYLITLSLLRVIAADLKLSEPAATCSTHIIGVNVDYQAYEHALSSISRADVLMVTTVCSVAAFGVLELCLLLARRAGMAGGEARDAECGRDAVPLVPEQHLEKQYFQIVP
ncbi:hypothetical protein C8F04DRAFT_1063893 [Mycena alexandri]|uniref:Uncharacterized protein n=1 Tax=Mycena alexandri TaxID=1745969 RepID=A0AAD6XDS9_9AGAR|nr:hypothetical protein C8F04DRAFT_1063893 [Mycena alexandri]